jgi:hypothetical protein
MFSSPLQIWKKDFVRHITCEPERTAHNITFKKDSAKHNIDFPAYAIYAPGTVTNVSYIAYYLSYYINRPYDEGPAEIWYYPNGKIKIKKYSTIWYRLGGGGPVFEDRVAHIGYYQNGNKKTEMYYQCYAYISGNAKVILHNLKGPAVTRYYEDGTKRAEFYFMEGDVHRKPHSEYSYKDHCYRYGSRSWEDIDTCGPAKIYYDRKGKIIRQQYYAYGKKLNLPFK